MRNVFKLFSYDIKHLFGNVITVVIVLGLVFLPSIFTWYNVIACWNVFDNTGNLKVAVAQFRRGIPKRPAAHEDQRWRQRGDGVARQRPA